MHRLSLRACCLIATLAACVLLAQAGPNRRYQGGPAGYGQRDGDDEITRRKADYIRKHHAYHDGPGYEQEEYKSYSERESYERRGDGPGSYHREEHYEGSDSGPGGYQHREEHYEKVDVKTFLLQESSRQADGAASNATFTSTFRCAKKEDEPDFCLHPSYPEERYGADHDASSFLEDVLAENNAAKCIWKATQEMCPPHVLGQCMTGVINCTISPVADECGCPYKGGVAFTSKGYFTSVEANSCVEKYNPGQPANGGRRRLASADASSYGFVNITTYNGTAWIFRGKLDTVVTREGAKEVKGGVEFVNTYAGAAAANYEDGPGYYHSGRDEYHGGRDEYHGGRDRYHGERSEGYSGERRGYSPEREYSPDRDSEGDYYGSYHRKPFVKGGSLKVTIVEAMHY